MKDRIAVLIPCYNESATVEKVVRDFRRVLPEAAIYVYDNNSTDGTGELAARAGAIVRRERMQGKGSVIRRMFREIDALIFARSRFHREFRDVHAGNRTVFRFGFFI